MFVVFENSTALYGDKMEPVVELAEATNLSNNSQSTSSGGTFERFHRRDTTHLSQTMSHRRTHSGVSQSMSHHRNSSNGSILLFEVENSLKKPLFGILMKAPFFDKKNYESVSEYDFEGL